MGALASSSGHFLGELLQHLHGCTISILRCVIRVDVLKQLASLSSHIWVERAVPLASLAFERVCQAVNLPFVSGILLKQAINLPNTPNTTSSQDIRQRMASSQTPP